VESDFILEHNKHIILKHKNDIVKENATKNIAYLMQTHIIDDIKNILKIEIITNAFCVEMLII